MDKRYFLIIVIFVACMFSLYNIALNSDVIGSANVECGKYICTLPNGFSKYDSDNTHVVCSDGKGMTIYIYTDLSNNSNYANKLLDIDQNKDYNIKSNGTINFNGLNIDSIFYYKENGSNRSTFYFNKNNDNFRIIITGFNYDTQYNETMDIACTIADSMRLNHKKA